jgi:hypothetical protein
MDSTKKELMQELLMTCLIEDLRDPDKCTPGLYQVVRGVLNDNKGDEDGIPDETLDFLSARISDAIPFKKGQA